MMKLTLMVESVIYDVRWYVWNIVRYKAHVEQKMIIRAYNEIDEIPDKMVDKK